jgi:hypothetical protein
MILHTATKKKVQNAEVQENKRATKLSLFYPST